MSLAPLFTRPPLIRPPFPSPPKRCVSQVEAAPQSPCLFINGLTCSLEKSYDSQRSRRYYPDGKSASHGPVSGLGKCALLSQLGSVHGTRWPGHKPQDPSCRMELLLHGCRSESNVFRRVRGKAHPQRTAAIVGESETLEL